MVHASQAAACRTAFKARTVVTRNIRQHRATATAMQPKYDAQYAPPESRRHVLLAIGALLAAAGSTRPVVAASNSQAASAAIAELQKAAFEAYGNRDFAEAVRLLNEIILLEPDLLRWREMRAQALVDGKNFGAALTDFDVSLSLLPPDAILDRARLLAGRGLAFEGLSDWVAALEDYEKALSLADVAGQLPDPYVLNSVANCHASLGEWKEARTYYLASAEGFQRASGFRRGRSMTPRLDGAVFAASNAALMLAQLGDEATAVREMQAVARRAPGSVDMRAALAALYWRQGQEAAAESEWEYACTRINAGCTKYQDPDWLITIRRWPPLMCEYLKDFLALRSVASNPSVARTGSTPVFRE